ncbi:MAG TPA: signal peptidase I [Verrucomicrobiae bacterium]|nr:signal peptidase I [Verrucomicrobiae bacterium]
MKTEAIDDATEIAPPARPIARYSSSWSEILESLLITILLALFGTTFVAQAYKIPSESMEPTLLVGDHLLVNKFIFGGNGAWYDKLLPYRDIRRGDIIVFLYPYSDHANYVKRVIGLPGDHLRIVHARVYINGQPLVEPYVTHDPLYADPFAENFPPAGESYLAFGLRSDWAHYLLTQVKNGEIVVPPHKYFVMGDNRDRSSDSRYWGFVDRDAVIGRPMFIYWSVRASDEDYANRGLAATLHGMEQTLAHLPSRTRWNRMLKEIH